MGDGQQGGAVQVDPIKATSKAPGTKRLRPKYDEPLSNFAFKCNLRRYNKADGRGLAELLEALANVDGVEWIRILYAYPSYFSESLIDAIADIPQAGAYIR